MKAKRIWILPIGVAFFVALAMCAAAQTVQETQAHIKVLSENKIVTVNSGDGQNSTFTFVTSEVGFESKVVKGVPFSADTRTEFSQTLANGQKIYRKSTASLARDSEGRTRREQTIDAIGVYGGTPHQTIVINDPVAGVSYVLNPETHVATKTPTTHMDLKSGEAGTVRVIARSTGTATGEKIIINGIDTAMAGAVVGGMHNTTQISSSINYRNESLGTMVIEGVSADGTKTIETIPAGSIGNDAPIEIVSERWYSPELGMVVKSLRSDPMSGENIYQLLNIRRTEPAAGLFQVPADYTVKEGPDVQIHTTIKK
jgi:hypothetical protein